MRSGENLDSTIAKFNKSTEGGFSKYKSSAQLIKARINNLINLNKQAGSVLELINKDSLSINDNRTNSLDSLYFIIAKIYQLDFMINDTAKVYLKKIATNFIDSKYRYQTITSLKNIEVDNENWKNLLIKEYPDSLHISDSSYKQISIIEDIDDGPFIKSEINKLEMLTQFKDLFSDEKDSISIIDTININMQLDTLNKVFENNEQ